MAKETMTVRVESKTRRALDALAMAIERDRSHVVNEAIRTYLETHEWQLRHIRKGLAEANAGTFVSAAEVKKLIGRLTRK